MAGTPMASIRLSAASRGGTLSREMRSSSRSAWLTLDVRRTSGRRSSWRRSSERDAASDSPYV